MEKGGRYLFVYGTLMSEAVGALGKAQRDRLARESRTLGAAAMTGAQLYDLGSYPGLVETGDPAHIVHGEVVELVDPRRTFPWLDAYEGIVPGDHDQNQYVRLERRVQLARGPELAAWVYVFRLDAARFALIPGGRWKRTL
jgi:gamma-glutamylcyclotransferase (GGCT)/AIG2-like uncharacterized protein YtfP